VKTYSQSAQLCETSRRASFPAPALVSPLCRVSFASHHFVSPSSPPQVSTPPSALSLSHLHRKPKPSRADASVSISISHPSLPLLPSRSSPPPSISTIPRSSYSLIHNREILPRLPLGLPRNGIPFLVANVLVEHGSRVPQRERSTEASCGVESEFDLLR